MTLEELEWEVISWAGKRKFFSQYGGSSPKDQVKKLGEEYIELFAGVYNQDPIEEKDGIGDMLVVLIIMCRMYGLTLNECLTHAYNEIKDRKGKMVNGIFVKE